MKIWAFAKAVPQSLAAGGMVSVSHMTAGRKLVETCESRESPAIQNPRFVVSAPGTEGWRNLAKGCQRHSKAILMVSFWIFLCPWSLLAKSNVKSHKSHDLSC